MRIALNRSVQIALLLVIFSTSSLALPAIKQEIRVLGVPFSCVGCTKQSETVCLLQEGVEARTQLPCEGLLQRFLRETTRSELDPRQMPRIEALLLNPNVTEETKKLASLHVEVVEPEPVVSTHQVTNQAEVKNIVPRDNILIAKKIETENGENIVTLNEAKDLFDQCVYASGRSFTSVSSASLGASLFRMTQFCFNLFGYHYKPAAASSPVYKYLFFVVLLIAVFKLVAYFRSSKKTNNKELERTLARFGLTPGASVETLRSRYKAIARNMHPDTAKLIENFQGDMSKLVSDYRKAKRMIQKSEQ